MVLHPETLHDAQTRHDLEGLCGEIRHCFTNFLRYLLDRLLEPVHDDDHEEGRWRDKEGELDVHKEQQAECPCDHDRVRDEIRDVVREDLFHFVRVADDAGDQFAGARPIEEIHGHSLDVLVEIGPKPVHRFLSQDFRQVVFEERGDFFERKGRA